MSRLLLALALLSCFAAATRTVSVRVEVVRAGYERARLEGQLREERERTRLLEARIAAATCPEPLLERARARGVELVEWEPGRTLVAPRPPFAETDDVFLVRR